ncbi:MAG TPA: hypothetical protein VHY08_01475 [Bacillota bacterium]|nr:hypothetical protein [Bacillota bacterium]
MKIHRSLLSIVFILVIIFVLSGLGNGASPTSNIGFGNATMPNNTVVSFGKTALSAVPVVIVSGQWNSVPWLTAAEKISKKSFIFKFYNPNSHQPIENANMTWMQYIAVVPDPKSPVLRAGSCSCKDGDYIKFSSKLSDTPIVVCSAENGSGVPLYANPANIDSGQFQISLKDMEGKPADGKLQYIAVLPSSSAVNYQNVKITAGSVDIIGGENIKYGFDFSDTPEAIVCSAYCEGMPNIAVASLSNASFFIGNIANFGGANPTDSSKFYWFGVSSK